MNTDHTIIYVSDQLTGSMMTGESSQSDKMKNIQGNYQLHDKLRKMEIQHVYLFPHWDLIQITFRSLESFSFFIEL